jgi:hypothetical protein
MDIVARIRRQGFRKWYERQLVDCHLAFVTCFLAGIVVASCLSALQLRGPAWVSAALLATAFVAGALCWYSWRRYITVLERAEAYGSRSTCPTCKAYSRFEIVASGSVAEGAYLDPQAKPLPYPWLRVQCRKCGTAWRLPD